MHPRSCNNDECAECLQSRKLVVGLERSMYNSVCRHTYCIRTFSGGLRQIGLVFVHMEEPADINSVVGKSGLSAKLRSPVHDSL